LPKKTLETCWYHTGIKASLPTRLGLRYHILVRSS